MPAMAMSSTRPPVSRPSIVFSPAIQPSEAMNFIASLSGAICSHNKGDHKAGAQGRAHEMWMPAQGPERQP